MTFVLNTGVWSLVVVPAAVGLWTVDAFESAWSLRPAVLWAGFFVIANGASPADSIAPVILLSVAAGLGIAYVSEADRSIARGAVLVLVLIVLIESTCGLGAPVQDTYWGGDFSTAYISGDLPTQCHLRQSQLERRWVDLTGSRMDRRRCLGARGALQRLR